MTMKVQQAAIILLALAAMLGRGHAQEQTRVQVDGKTCVVTEYPQSPHVPTRMVMLTGPLGNAMIKVDKSGKITAIIS
ncbi:MAG TPA: hypothetical protein VF742_12215, partial [Terracidiphilus sp.]